MNYYTGEQYLAPLSHQQDQLHGVHLLSSDPKVQLHQSDTKQCSPSIYSLNVKTGFCELNNQDNFFSKKYECPISPQCEGDSFTNFGTSKKTEGIPTQSRNSSTTLVLSESQIKKEINNNLMNVNQKNSNSTKRYGMNQVLKVIEKKVKTPRIYSYYFRRKKLAIKAICKPEIETAKEVIIFGNISIEEDISDNSSFVPTSATSMFQVVRLVKHSVNLQSKKYKNFRSQKGKKKDKDMQNFNPSLNKNHSAYNLELELNVTHSSQQTNFKFLSDHLKKSSSPMNQRLSKALIDYSKLISTQIMPHISNVNKLMSESEDFENEMSQTFDTAMEQIKRKIDSLTFSESLFKYSILKINFNTKQFDTVLSGFNSGILKVLEESENDYFQFLTSPHRLLTFETHSDGENRKFITAQFLESITKQSKNSHPREVIIQTLDGINVQAQATSDFYFTEDLLDIVPPWMIYLDLVVCIVKYKVEQSQLSFLNSSREQKKLENLKINQITFVKESENEINYSQQQKFLQLFYPQKSQKGDYFSDNLMNKKIPTP